MIDLVMIDGPIKKETIVVKKFGFRNASGDIECVSYDHRNSGSNETFEFLNCDGYGESTFYVSDIPNLIKALSALEVYVKGSNGRTL